MDRGKMEDTIEICSGCGKIPRIMDKMSGFFVCSRCGERSTIFVQADDYERVATDLDKRFHEMILRKKSEEAKAEPLIIPKAKAKKKTSAKAPIKPKKLSKARSKAAKKSKSRAKKR